MLNGLIFDVDGTLADTEQGGHRVAFNQAFAEQGLDWHWDQQTYARLLSVFGGKERIRYYIDHFLENFAAPWDLDGFVRDLHSRKTRHYVRLVGSGAIALRPGVQRLLAEARAEGMKLGIASTTTFDNVTALIESAPGDASMAWFDSVAVGDMAPEKKPAPDIYILAMRQLGLSAAHCIAIEDSGSGLRSARGAGLPVVITVTGATRKEDFNGAELVLDHLGEPDLPFTVLVGDAGTYSFVSVELLRFIHARARI